MSVGMCFCAYRQIYFSFKFIDIFIRFFFLFLFENIEIYLENKMKSIFFNQYQLWQMRKMKASEHGWVVKLMVKGVMGVVIEWFIVNEPIVNVIFLGFKYGTRLLHVSNTVERKTCKSNNRLLKTTL